MPSSLSKNQMPAGVSAEEADLLQRSKKKTKRGLFERDNDPIDMEEEDPANPMPKESKTGKEQVNRNNKYVKAPAISFKRALTGMRHKEVVKLTMSRMMKPGNKKTKTQTVRWSS